MSEGQRLAEIQTIQVSSQYPRQVGLNSRRGIHGTGPTSRAYWVVTNQGASGWGLARSGDLEMGKLVGRPLAELFDPAVGVIAPEAAPLDFALHDLAGQIIGQPVWRLLGAHGPRRTPCYDGAIYMDDLLPEGNPRGTDAIMENCRQDWALGYRAFKLKIGRGYQWMPPEEGLARDIAVTRRVRAEYPQADILVDGNDVFTCDHLLRYLDAVADCGLYWIEEPFPENRDDLLRLREYLARHSPRTLIADGEAKPDIQLLMSLARERLVDVLLMDVVGWGFTTWREWMPRIREIGVQTAPHAWGDPLKTRYAAQLAAGLGNVLILEGVPGTSADADWSGYRFAEGILSVPDAPGFGVSLRAQ